MKFVFVAVLPIFILASESDDRSLLGARNLRTRNLPHYKTYGASGLTFGAAANVRKPKNTDSKPDEIASPETSGAAKSRARTLPLFQVFGTTWKLNNAPKRHSKKTAPKEEPALIMAKKADVPEKSPMKAQKLSFNAPDPVAEETKKPEAPAMKAQTLSFKTKPKEEYNPTRPPVTNNDVSPNEYNPTRPPVTQENIASPDEYNPTRPPVKQEEPPKNDVREKRPMMLVFG